MSQNTIQNKRKQNHQVKKSFIAKQTKVVRQGPGNIIFRWPLKRKFDKRLSK